MSDKELFEELSYETKSVFESVDDDTIKEIFEFNKGYIDFLNVGKTERECVAEAERQAMQNGFVKLEDVSELKAGDKVYTINRNKNILLAVIGTDDIENGINLVGAHIDSPRLDLKQNPLYEDGDMAFLKTHYYGGIKKYQWTAIPLAMHGVMFTRDGKRVDIRLGEEEGDPVFCITDLLPHLAADQMSKTMLKGVEGESLNILIGGMGVKSEDVKEKVKFNILKILSEKYGVSERDFISAEIELVPAFKANDVGLDRSMVGSYGQDDRVCAYTSLKSIFDVKSPKKTAVCILVDKEEIGSVGNTGMLSGFFEMMIAEMVSKIRGGFDYIAYNKVIRNSACMSSDVGAAFDPTYSSVYEKKNSAYAGRGMVIMKYTGARGKSESSDANAEFVYKICKILDDNNVSWQTAELGKVDQGGGGTIAQYVANLNMDVIDCGVPVLSMHSPFEVVSKADVYMAYKSYIAFFNDR